MSWSSWLTSVWNSCFDIAIRLLRKTPGRGKRVELETGRSGRLQAIGVQIGRSARNVLFYVLGSVCRPQANGMVSCQSDAEPDSRNLT